MPFMAKVLKESELDKAANILLAGGVVAFRTETVYGVATKLDCAHKLFEVKKREQSKKLVMQFGNLKAAKKYFGGLREIEEQFIAEFGGLITVIHRDERGEHDCVAFRIPDDPIAREILLQCGEPLYVTSANISGEAAALTWMEAFESVGEDLDAIVMSGPCELGVATTLVDINEYGIEIIREGAVPTHKITDFYNKVKRPTLILASRRPKGLEEYGPVDFVALEPHWLEFNGKIIVPHFDGKEEKCTNTDEDIMGEYLIPQSYKMEIIALEDDAYILIANGVTKYFGNVYTIKNGDVIKRVTN